MATIPASENEFPSLLFVEGAAPATPAAGLVICYVKADGLLYCKDDAGTETAYTPATHIADTTDAHDASAVSFDPTGLGVIAATEVQTALEEVDAAIGAGGIPATIIDAAGDLIVGTADDTAGRLAIGATNGMALQRVSGAVAWALPPGYQFDYAETTSTTSITATTEAGATTIVTGNAVTYDGSTAVWIEAWFSVCDINGTAADMGQICLYDGSSSIGKAEANRASVTGVTNSQSVGFRRKITPSNASHTYSIRGFKNAGTFVIGGGAGGSGNNMPGFIRITKA